MKVWIQSADFDAREFDLNENAAKRLFVEHDWVSEVRKQNAREEAGNEACPPGIGFVRDDGRILHLCPDGRNSMVYFHRPKKILGLFWAPNRVLTGTEISNGRASELIGYFYRKEDDHLEDIAY